MFPIGDHTTLAAFPSGVLTRSCGWDDYEKPRVKGGNGKLFATTRRI